MSTRAEAAVVIQLNTAESSDHDSGLTTFKPCISTAPSVRPRTRAHIRKLVDHPKIAIATSTAAFTQSSAAARFCCSIRICVRCKSPVGTEGCGSCPSPCAKRLQISNSRRQSPQPCVCCWTRRSSPLSSASATANGNIFQINSCSSMRWSPQYAQICPQQPVPLRFLYRLTQRLQTSAQCLQRSMQSALDRRQRHSCDLRNLLQFHSFLKTQADHFAMNGRQFIDDGSKQCRAFRFQQLFAWIRTARHQPLCQRRSRFIRNVQAAAVLAS